MRNALAFLILLAMVLLDGCEHRPRAPVLRDDPVYENTREGIRFLAPEGWKQTMRGEAPPGKVERERTLVEYTRMGGLAGASIRVSLADFPASRDLAAYLAGPSYGAEKWRQTAPAADTPVGSATGTRYAFVGQVGKEEMAREVVVVRRGERVYFFTVLFGPKDTEMQEQLRRVVASVIWK